MPTEPAEPAEPTEPTDTEIDIAEARNNLVEKVVDWKVLVECWYQAVLDEAAAERAHYQAAIIVGEARIEDAPREHLAALNDAVVTTAAAFQQARVRATAAREKMQAADRQYTLAAAWLITAQAAR